MSKYIVSNEKILGGSPVIVGTRIPAERILYLFRDGYTIEAIHDEYPQLNPELIYKVIDEIAQNLKTNQA